MNGCRTLEKGDVRSLQEVRNRSDSLSLEFEKSNSDSFSNDFETQDLGQRPEKEDPRKFKTIKIRS